MVNAPVPVPSPVKAVVAPGLNEKAGAAVLLVPMPGKPVLAVVPPMPLNRFEVPAAKPKKKKNRKRK